MVEVAQDSSGRDTPTTALVAPELEDPGRRSSLGPVMGCVLASLPIFGSPLPTLPPLGWAVYTCGTGVCRPLVSIFGNCSWWKEALQVVITAGLTNSALDGKVKLTSALGSIRPPEGCRGQSESSAGSLKESSLPPPSQPRAGVS